MSKTKAMHVFDRLVWAYDNAHDIVLAHLAEAAEADSNVDEHLLMDWRVWASIPDLALTYPREDDVQPDLMLQLLSSTRARVEDAGDVTASMLSSWSVLPGERVSGGFLRTDTMPATALVDVVDALADLVAERFEPDPSGAWWYIGVPGGRTTIPMRQRSSRGE